MNGATRTVLVGTDWWTDCDDVVAMRVLLWAERQGMVKVAAIGLNACMEHSVPSLDAFLTSEGRPDIALGIDRKADDFGGRPPYQAGMLAYPHARGSNDDAEDAVRMYRRCLAAAEDRIDVIEIGYPQVLAELLGSSGDDLSPLSGLELVRAKVGKLWMMAGNWEDESGGLENNFARNARSRKAGSVVCEQWPTPITFLGWEIASEILTGGTIVAPEDPVARALRDHGSPNGRSSWDPMLVLLACIGDEEEAGYLLAKGTASVDAGTGANSFCADPEGKHGYVRKRKPDRYYRLFIDGIMESARR